MVKFSIIWEVWFSLYASSIPGFLSEYNPFKTVDIAIAVWVGSSNANGFNPGELGESGSIRFTGIPKLSATSLILEIVS